MSLPASSSFVPSEPFQPAWGMSGPHAQTILGVLLRPVRAPKLRRERWDTPDGDFLDVDFVDGPADGPWVYALHGLEGSSRSGYILEVLRGARARGWGAVALNFRSCSGEPNRLLRSYNSGDTRDARWVLSRLRKSLRGPLFGVGFSLGGNVLLRLLAEDGEHCALDAAVAVSVPFDLAHCGAALDKGRGWVGFYRRRFLRTLKPKSLAAARRHPGTLEPEAIRAARGIVAFDDAVTSKVFGFDNAADYYARCSSGPELGKIRRPTLLITSTDDPLVPGGSVPPGAQANPFLSWALTEQGGHVGFIAGSALRPRFWAESQAMRFLAERAVPT